MENVTKNLRDAVYVTVGLGVISYQRAQAGAEQVRDRLAARRVELDKAVTQLAKDIETRFEPVLSQARTAAEQAQTNLRTYFNTNRAAA